MGEDSGQPKGTIAVVDDDEAARVSMAQMLTLRGYRAEAFSSAEVALAWPGLPEAECVVTDVKMPGMDGEAFLAEATRRGFLAPIVMVTGHGDIAMAVRCLKAGAYDFVEKPYDDEILVACVARATERSRLRRESHELRTRLTSLSPGEDGRLNMVGRSQVMQDLYQEIEVVAGSDAPVVIRGETGAGKELVARAIHSQSPRGQAPFVALNAGALPEAMLESEIFGHAKGAFTGADREREGKLLTASGGSLLLDEVESLALRAQVKLLRVLEDNLVTPLGRDRPRQVDVRLLTTTQHDLRDAVRDGSLREDFYHRIAVLSITVPPLRSRTEDIPVLASHFAKCAAEGTGIPVPEIPETTLADMMRYAWPGNVRELRNVVQRLVITSHAGLAGPFLVGTPQSETRHLSVPPAPGRLREAMEQTEKAAVESALRETDGEVTAAALALGISRRALYERMRKYGLRRESRQP